MNPSILIVDDEEDIREVMALALTDAGYAVRAAADGESGVRMCTEDPPQIVITDIRMPGMDGLQVLERLKQQKRGVIISDRVYDTFIKENEVKKAGARYLNRALEEKLASNRVSASPRQ